MDSDLLPSAEDQRLFRLAVKDLDKQLSRAEKAIKTLQEIGTSIMPAKKNANLGTIPKSIYEKRPLPQTDILSRLPAEIRAAVWSYLSADADRISLALTCKLNATMFEELKPIQHVRKVKSITISHRMMVLIRLVSWVPKSYRLCFHCIRFCARKTGGWGGQRSYEDDAIALDQKNRTSAKRTSSGSTIPRGALVSGPQCPLCIRRAAAEQNSFKATHRELKALLAKHKIIT